MVKAVEGGKFFSIVELGYEKISHNTTAEVMNTNLSYKLNYEQDVVIDDFYCPLMLKQNF